MRNPSPPPLTEEEKKTITADYIGETLFSKKWVLATLLKLYKHDTGDIYIKEKSGDDNEELDKLELNEKFEDEVCELWDICVNSDVAMFLYANEVKEVLIETLDKTKSPRLMEISFGILGNLLCVDEICVSYSSDEKLKETLFSYLTVADALSLVELTRTIFVCLSNYDCLPLWISSFYLHMKKLVNILQNSLNIDLLHHVINIIDIVFDSGDDIIEESCNVEFLQALQDSYIVLQKEKRGEIITTLMHIFQLISTVNKGVIVLSDNECIGKFLLDCLTDYENDVYVVEQKDQFCSSIFSTFDCILSVNPNAVIGLVDGNINILNDLINCISQRLQCSDDVSDGEEMYLSIYIEFLYNFCKANTDNAVNITKFFEENKEKVDVSLLQCQQLTKLPDYIRQTAESISDTLIKNASANEV